MIRAGRSRAWPAAAAPDVETASDLYARRFDGPVGELLLGAQTTALRDLLAPFHGASVLDVGGGHAQAAALLVADGHHLTVTGSEASCRVRLDRLLPAGSFAFERAPLDVLPFPDDSFDVVVALRLLAHAPRWETLLAELCRVSREALVVDYPPRSGLHRMARPLFAWKRAIEQDTRPYRTFAPGTVERACEALGWELTAERRELLLPFVLHRLLGAPRLSGRVERAAGRLGLTRRWGAPVLLRASPRRH
jgi:SAM-dependent methyltransferase